MRRPVLAAVAATMFIPLSASAQLMPLEDEQPWGARVRFTPFVGHAPAVTRVERYVVAIDDALTESYFEVDFGSGNAVGAELEVRLVERFALIGGATYVRRGETVEFAESTGEFFQREGSDFLLAKAGVAMRLREAVSEMQLRQLTAAVFVAPTYIREMPRPDSRIDPLLQEDMSAWGVSLGLDAEVPLGSDRVAAQVGFEDALTFWNEDEMAERNDRLFAQSGITTRTEVNTEMTHQWLVRVGLTFRLN